MLGLVVTLLIIALIAGILGFGGIAGAAVGIAKIVFFVALVLFLISLIFGGSAAGLAGGSKAVRYVKTRLLQVPDGGREAPRPGFDL
jgi:uncharacterized membrane protein YtjA (UPF0391 family)